MGNNLNAEDKHMLPEDIEDDVRVRRWRARLSISAKDLERLYLSAFLMYADTENGPDGGIISREDFFKWTKEPESEIGHAMLDFVDPHSKTHLTFGEILEVICIFCRFRHVQMVNFVFVTLDHERQHFIPIDEFRAYVEKSHNGEGSFQINHGFQVLSSISKGGLVSYEEMVHIDQQFPYLLYPSFKMQIALIKRSFGDRYWEIKKTLIVDDAAIAALRKKANEDEHCLFGEEAVRKRMGNWYYITPWKREKNRDQLLRLAAIDAELDAMVDAMWRHSHPEWVDKKEDDEIKVKPDNAEEKVKPDEKKIPLPSLIHSSKIRVAPESLDSEEEFVLPSPSGSATSDPGQQFDDEI